MESDFLDWIIKKHINLMKYYPVAIPTLCRYQHFRSCVESLSRNTHANKTELVIGLDFPPSEKYRLGYEKIKAYLPQIKGFAKVTVFEHKMNLGTGENISFLKNYVFSNYDACILTEDDNEFSLCFLDYMNKALNLHFDNSMIMSVSGHCPYEWDAQGNHTTFCSIENNCWGLGIWKHKEEIYNDATSPDYRIFVDDILKNKMKVLKIFFLYPYLLRMLINMRKKNLKYGDAIRALYNINYSTYQLKPAAYLVSNKGLDGTGLHSGIEPEFKQGFLSNSSTFDVTQNYNLYNTFRNWHKNFNFMLPNNIIRKCGCLLKTIFIAIKY